MKGLPSLLLVLVVVTHYGYELLAGFYPDPAAAARAWFYVLRGFEGAVLYLAVWSLFPHGPVWSRYGASLACAWGALESVQTAVCRLALGIEAKPTTTPYTGLCDIVTGWPVYMLTLVLVLIVVAVRK